MRHRSTLVQKELFEISKLIDNNFIGTEKTFSGDRKRGYFFLSTNKCDWASLIRIGDDKITRICDDTEGWDKIQYATLQKVNDYLISIDVEPYN